MANVELKTDFKDGEVLFGEQLNNNFKAIKAALEAANKIAWQDNLDDEVIAFKGTTEEINRRAIINGQLLYDIEKGISYIDIADPNVIEFLGKERIKLSGGEGIAIIDSGDYADIIEEGIYLIKSNKVTDRLSPMSGTINQNYNKLMYVLNSGGSTRPNVKQVLMDGFDFYIRTAYLNGTSSAYSATAWEERTIGEGGTGGSSIHIGEEEPTDASTLWIDSDSFNSVGSEVVDSLEGDELTKAPSVKTVNSLRNIITATFSANHTITTTDVFETVLLNSANIFGDKFELTNDGGILIKRGISKIKVGANINFQTVTEGLKYIAIYKNNEVIIQNVTNIKERTTLTLSPSLCDVTENDIIYLKVMGTKSDILRRSAVFSNITLEVV